MVSKRGAHTAVASVKVVFDQVSACFNNCGLTAAIVIWRLRLTYTEVALGSANNSNTYTAMLSGASFVFVCMVFAMTREVGE